MIGTSNSASNLALSGSLCSNFILKTSPKFSFAEGLVSGLPFRLTSPLFIKFSAWFLATFSSAAKNASALACASYKILIAQYFIPQIYERVIVRGYERLSEICAKCDGAIIDASIDLIARVAVKSGEGADRVSNSGDLSANLRWMVLGSFILLILAFAL